MGCARVLRVKALHHLLCVCWPFPFPFQQISPEKTIKLKAKGGCWLLS